MSHLGYFFNAWQCSRKHELAGKAKNKPLLKQEPQPKLKKFQTGNYIESANE